MKQSHIGSDGAQLPLLNKSALVIGGSRGIGAAIAKRLGADGADVALTYVSSTGKAEAVAGEIKGAGRKAMAIRADSRNSVEVMDAVANTVEALGGLDIIVNNAGVFPFGPLEAVTARELDETLAIHVRTSFLAVQAAVPHMQRGGAIISIGTCFVARVPIPGLTLYTMSKAALNGMTKGLARDLGERGITANVIHPGPIDTDMNPADGPEADSELVALGRYGEGSDIAAMAAFLAGPGGRYITGEAIAVDGGFAA